MGSAATDLDSVVGSLSYAYLLDREGGCTAPVFPFLPIPRSDFPLRSEVAYLFDRVCLEWNDLMFADDIDLADLLTRRGSRLVLVDDQGGDLAPELRARITEVIDHHPVLSAEQPPRDVAGNLSEEGSPRRLKIVEPVGSACTLVGRQILRRKAEILTPGLATLLLAAILLDTVNLDPEAGRATPRDVEVAGSMRQAGADETADLYQTLVQARVNVEGLSSEQVLKKDYKEYTAGTLRLGMSSVPLLLDSWQRIDAALTAATTAFMRKRALDLLVVCLYEQNDSFRRQLILCTREVRLLARLSAALSDPLGLREIPGGCDRGGHAETSVLSEVRTVEIRCFEQSKAGVSRKRIEPLIREVVAER
jgi:exopolyphosphatase